MGEEFYTVEPCEELVSALLNATDSLKYILNTTQDKEDNKLVTEELLEAYENIAGYCKDFINAYDYYIKAENWKCANAEALLQHVKEFNKQFQK